MKNRFFVDADLAAGAIVSLSDEERHHARVVRVREGEEVEVFNGRGASFMAKYESPEAIRVLKETANRELRTAIHLAMSIIQLEKFELVLQKATELGVASIIPMITDRCEVRPERYRGKIDRWEKIAFEAVKQSGRSVIPRVEQSTTFAEVIKRDGPRIIFDADESPSTTEQPSNPVTLLIGPEGGWSEAELEAARRAGCLFRQLGNRRLRAETAGIVAVALVAAQMHDI